MGINKIWYPTEAKCYVTSDAALTHPSFKGNEHTTGKGSFMVVNGSHIANSSVWCQTIKVQPHIIYSFSTWLCSAAIGNPASLRISINGKNLGSPFNAPESLYTWIQFYEVGDSGNDSTATICIVNQNTIKSGNDFGLDDISFSTCLPKLGVNLNLGPDQKLCAGQSLRLSAGGTAYTYIGSNGSTDSILNVNDTGTYWVTISKDSCVATDTIRITDIVNPPQVNIGNDTFLCGGQYIIDAGNPGVNFTWSTGDTTQSITITKGGIYWVKVGTTFCSDSDGVLIDLFEIPQNYLGPDTNLCEEDTLHLDATQITIILICGKTVAVSPRKLYILQEFIIWNGIYLPANSMMPYLLILCHALK